MDYLYCDAILTSPIDYDYGEGLGEEGGWDTIIPDTQYLSLAECRQILDDNDREYPLPNPFDPDMTREKLVGFLLDKGEAEGLDLEGVRGLLVDAIEDESVYGLEEWRSAVHDCYLDGDRFHPMMSLFYPLPHYHGDAGSDQIKLDREAGPVCLVEVKGEVGLALTGGGMDLSWDICHAYVLLGYRPPFCCCDLPQYADTRLTGRAKLILDACVESCEIAARWAGQRAEKLRTYQRELTHV